MEWSAVLVCRGIVYTHIQCTRISACTHTAADTHPLLHFKISTLNENWQSVHQHGTNLFNSLRSTLHSTRKEVRTSTARQ